MAKLSDLFLNTLGNALQGASVGIGGGNVPEYFARRQKQQQESAKSRLSAMLALAKAGATDEYGRPINVGREQFASAGIPDIGGVSFPSETSLSIPVEDESGNITVQNVPVRRGSKTTGVMRYPRTSGGGLGKPPTGYRYKSGTDELESIPGGPAARKIESEEEKARGLRESAIGQADTVIGKVDQALKGVSGWSTGWGAKLLGGLPATDANSLKNDVDTIKANLGFSTLQEMRRNSPTGGALGQVAVQELDMLQKTVSSLDPLQKSSQVRRNLNEVKRHFENWQNAIRMSGTEDGRGQIPVVGGGGPQQLLGRIRVRNRVTGQTGTVSQSSYEANQDKYEPL